MPIQPYKDLSLIFGPPAGKFFDNIVLASEQTGISRCEIYVDMLFEIVDKAEEKGVFNQLFSAVIGEDLTIGEIHQTKQTFRKVRPDIEKLVTTPDESVSVPLLMFFPSQFQTFPDDPIKNVVTADHLRWVGAILGRSWKLDWVQTIAVHDSQVA